MDTEGAEVEEEVVAAVMAKDIMKINLVLEVSLFLNCADVSAGQEKFVAEAEEEVVEEAEDTEDVDLTVPMDHTAVNT